jgi:DNA-binding SARP family transcriptional activator
MRLQRTIGSPGYRIEAARRTLDRIMLRLHTLGGLWIDGYAADGGDLPPRRLALLALLAAAGPKGMSRERVLALLWPESDSNRARHSLSQALYSLRRSLGVEVVITTPNLKLDPARMTSDLDAFRAASAGKDWERAADLFVGPFVDGFYLAGAPDFERWVDEERLALSREGQQAIESAARVARGNVQLARSADYWRRLTRLDPLNGRIAQGYVDVLSEAGEHESALQHAESHAALVRREMAVEPDPAIASFIDSARSRRALERDPTPSVRAVSSRTVPVVGPARRVSLALASASRRVLRPWLALATFAAGALAAVLWRAPGASDWSSKASAIDGEGTGSPVAQRLYDEGLRAFYRSDTSSAERLFRAAAREDSTHVMSSYFVWRVEAMANGPRSDSLAHHAARLAASAPERDRLLIITDVAASRWDLRAIQFGDTLLARYPNDVDALISVAEIESDPMRSLTLLDRAIAIDSSMARNARTQPPCRLCYALGRIASRFEAADSIAGVEETLLRWISLRPDDYQPWRARAQYSMRVGKHREAMSAMRRADSLGAPHADSAAQALVRALHFDDLESSNAICRDQLVSSDLADFTRFRWLCTISLRMQGRHREALRLARSGRVPGSTVVRANAIPDLREVATIDLEMGRPSAAVAAFSNLAAQAERHVRSDGGMARQLAWELTLAGHAMMLARDTIGVRALVDSVELLGHRSLDRRDARLHHFLRGLLHADAHEHERAVREFRAAVSPPFPSRGSTRINYEMSKSLLVLRRPTEAVSALQSALRGRFDESSQHVTRTQLHELAAQAFAAAGQRDSAAHHYAIVERAWRYADSSFTQRYLAARRALSHLRRPAR